MNCSTRGRPQWPANARAERDAGHSKRFDGTADPAEVERTSGRHRALEPRRDGSLSLNLSYGLLESEISLILADAENVLAPHVTADGARVRHIGASRQLEEAIDRQGLDTAQICARSMPAPYPQAIQ